MPRVSQSSKKNTAEWRVVRVSSLPSHEKGINRVCQLFRITFLWLTELTLKIKTLIGQILLKIYLL